MSTKIQWCDETHNPWWGCEKVSPACDNCYAETYDKREVHKPMYTKGRHWGKNTTRHTWPHDSEHWRQPLIWNKKAERNGVRLRVFCGSMCDVMEDRSDLTAERTKLYEVIEQTPYLDWLLLTKRPQNFRRFLPSAWINEPQKNVWLMTTVESQDYIWRIDELMKAPAVVHGISAEPLLGPINLPQNFLDLGEAGWVITGGESGRNARTKNDGEWYRNLMKQCHIAGIPFFFKQHGTYIGREPLVKIMKTMTFKTKAEAETEKQRLQHTFDGKVHQSFPVIRYCYEYNEWRDTALDLCAIEL
ncbi:MAG TPA: DUF5131 family protein [Paludibaculum sp.]|jgi:protein gp37